MSVSTTTNKVQYNCNGSQTIFPFTFPIFQTTDLQVILTDNEGNETTLTETTDYTVSATNNDYTNGGNVTTVKTYASGYKITIVRILPIKQEVDYRENDPFPAETLEDELDKLTMIAQQLDEKISRNVQVPISDEVTSLELPNKATRASHFLGFDADGAPITGDPTNVPVTPYIQTLLDDPDALTAQSTLGVSNYIKSLLDDADKEVAKNTLEAAPNKGYIAVSLTNYDNTSLPAIAAGSEIEVNRVNVKFTSETAISGTATSGSTNYIYTDSSGNVSWTTTAPTWDSSKNAWMDATGTYRYIGGCYYDGTDYTGKWVCNTNIIGVDKINEGAEFNNEVTRYYSVSLVGVILTNAWGLGTQGARGYIVYLDNGDSRQYWFGAVNLPDGATVKELRFYVDPASLTGTEQVVCKLIAHDMLSSNSYIDMAGVTLSAGQNSGTDNTILYSTIDNSVYSYAVWVYVSTGSSATIRGARIKYTIKNPLP